MKKMIRKRLLSLLLALSLSIPMFPLNADAAIADTYTSDAGVTYYKVDSENFDQSTQMFIQDLLTAKNSQIGGQSIAALWQSMAFRIQDRHGRGTGDSKFKTQFDNVIQNGLAYKTKSTGSYSKNHSNGDNDYNVRASGITYASSMKKAGEAMETKLFNDYRAAGGGREDKYGNTDSAAIAKNGTLNNDSSSQDVFWMLTDACKTSGSNKKGHYQAIGILFHNFKIAAILPSDSGDFYQTVESSPDPSKKTFASAVNNMTDLPVSAQQEVSSTTTTTATSSINGSESYGFSESVSVGFEKNFFFGTLNTELNFTATQTIEKGWEESESNTQTDNKKSTVTVELPPYTSVMIRQSDSETTITTTYDCPVALVFDVTIVEYTLDPSDNNADCKNKILATFTGDARKNLRTRAVTNQSLTDKNDIDWDALYNANSGWEKIVDNQLSAAAPMSATGAVYTVVQETTTSEVFGVAPVYALASVKLKDSNQEFKLTDNGSLDLTAIELAGYNRQNAAYYGFDAAKGHWIMVDESGNEQKLNPAAALSYNSLTGSSRLTAGNESGTVYLKYLIDEDVYSTSGDINTFTTNADLDSTVIIQVDVTITGDDSASRIPSDGFTVTSDNENPDTETKDEGREGPVSFAFDKDISTFWHTRYEDEDGNPAFQDLPATLEIDMGQTYIIDQFDYLPRQDSSFNGIVLSYELYGKAEENDDYTLLAAGSWEKNQDMKKVFFEPIEVRYLKFVATDGSGELGERYASAAEFYIHESPYEPTPVNPFTDVSYNDYFYDAVLWAVNNKITNGRTETAFAPYDKCSRADIVTFLYRAMDGNPSTSECSFIDVNPEEYYYKPMLWAVEQGITTGLTANTFGPYELCTREQIVTFLWRALGKPDSSAEVSFSDVTANDYFYEAVRWAVEAGVTTGQTPTSFGTYKPCVRADSVLFLQRALK